MMSGLGTLGGDSLAQFSLAAAAFGAGMLNAIAGGGTFLTLPALIFAGLPAISANATSTVAVMPGYVGGAIGFWRDMLQVERRTLVMTTVVTAVGGVGGSLLLLVTPDKAFKVIVPWLLLFATVLFAASARPRARPASPTTTASQIPTATQTGTTPATRPWWENPALGAVAVYGGYFNGGLGILLMAVLSLGRGMSLNTINGLKNYLSALLSVTSIAVFATAGIVDWRAAVWMMGFSMLGGYAGARLAQRLPVRLVYAFVVLTGLVMSAVFFIRL